MDELDSFMTLVLLLRLYQDGTLTDSDALHFEAYKMVLELMAPEFNGEAGQ